MDTMTKSKEGVEDEEKIREEAKRQALEKVKQKVTIVNIDELAEAEARKAADAYMTEDKENLKGIKGWAKKLWKHTFFDEYYRQRQINRTREDIKNSDNIYAGRIKGDNNTAHENTMQGISERFISEYDETLSDGEKKKILDNKDPEVIKSSTDIKNLITDYAKGTINDDAFKNEKTRILNNLNGQDDILKGTNNYADNLFEIAKNAKIAVEHGAKLEELDLDTNIIIGKAKSSLKTEAHFNLVDKAIDKMKKSKVGRFISPAVLSTAIGIAYSVTVGVSKKVMSSKAAAIVTLGGAVAVSAAFAGTNESHRVALERKQHGIEMAEGGDIDPGSKRRKQMEKYGYQMENSNDLAKKLRNLMFIKDKDGKDVMRDDIKEDEVVTIMAQISDIEARNSLNAKNKIDLISYSNIGNVEKERTDLTILTARAKVELRKKVESSLKNGIPTGETFDSYLQKQTQVVEDSLLGGEKGITAQDKAFRRYKAGRIAKKMVQTAVVGLVVGGTIQETVAFFNDDVQGLVEGVFHHDSSATTQTPFENIHDWISRNPSHVDMSNAINTNFEGHDIKLPEGMSLLHNPDGTCDIMKGDKLISDNISLNFDANGDLDTESMAKLGEAGIIANTTHSVINSTEEVTSNGSDYINNHQENTHHISRDGWYDNDTPKPIFDQNELKLQWGGEAGSAGIDANGNYVLDVGNMTSDGSFHQDFSVDAQEQMKNGGLKMILSLTQETQHQVFEVPIDASGKAVIDPNSEIGKLFFGNEDGHAIFKGRFAEVVQSFGEHDGAEHVKTLATLVGEGNDSIINTIETHTDLPITTIQPPMDTQPPMFIPVVARNPLESIRHKKFPMPPEPIPYNPYYGSILDSKNWRDDFSPRLINNPDAKLDPKEEISWYFEDQKRRYPGYIENELSKLESQNTEPLSKKVEAIICVAAAGHQEHENIYKTLDTYRVQKDRNKKSVWNGENSKFEIFLYINWPTGQSPQKTLDEIERFKKNHPEVKVRVYKEEITTGKVELGWYKKKIFDLALKKHAETGSEKDIIIITNDADMTFTSNNYLENSIDSLNDPKNKRFDAVLGRYDLDPEIYRKNPTFHVAIKFWQFMESVMRSKYGLIGTQGRNTIMRGSSYAAVGGNRTREFWGDIEFGQLFDEARGRSSVAYSNDAWVTVDPRREIDKFKSGEKIAYTWGGDFNSRDVRGTNKSENMIPEDLDVYELATLEENNPIVISFKKRLQEEMQEIFNFFIAITPGVIKYPNESGINKEIHADIKMLAERAAEFLGIKLKITKVNNNYTSLEIIDSSKLRLNLKKYNENNSDQVKMNFEKRKLKEESGNV